MNVPLYFNTITHFGIFPGEHSFSLLGPQFAFTEVLFFLSSVPVRAKNSITWIISSYSIYFYVRSAVF